jgi:hypothetical protein
MSIFLELVPETDILELEVEVMHVVLYLLSMLGEGGSKGLTLDDKEEGK